MGDAQLVTLRGADSSTPSGDDGPIRQYRFVTPRHAEIQINQQVIREFQKADELDVTLLRQVSCSPCAKLPLLS